MDLWLFFSCKTCSAVGDLRAIEANMVLCELGLRCQELGSFCGINTMQSRI